MIQHIITSLLFLGLLNYSVLSHQLEHTTAPSLSAKISKFLDSESNPVPGKKWALLVAGSRGYSNYRHQADICHAYQILKKGGLKAENIIVFMYDDIAYNKHNPKRGVIVNSPSGGDVYKGVPKDYTGKHTTIHNLFSVILGNRSALTGGSRKVLDSGPDDHIFIYYTDHGSPGVVSMPCDEYLYADELNKVLKEKHDSNGYKSMAFYLEACESGSMFEGLLSETLNIYATTASNATEDSYAAYCPFDDYLSSSSSKYDVCLGDVYSVSWMEDSEKNDLQSETLEQQFEVVRQRTAGENVDEDGSHVMQYGNLELNKELVYSYMGKTQQNHTQTLPKHGVKFVSQHEAELLHYRHKFHRAPKGSETRLEAEKQLNDEINSRAQIDNNIKQISTLLFGAKNDVPILNSVRKGGKPLVDDWTCLKAFVKTYEEYCGVLTRYGMKYTRAFANMCNAGITIDQMIMASTGVCKTN